MGSMKLEIGKRYLDTLGGVHLIVERHPGYHIAVVDLAGDVFETETGRALYLDKGGGIWGSIPADPNNLVSLHHGDDECPF